MKVRFFKGAPFSVEAPNFVELTITHSEPGVRGDTATGTTKPATLETGYKLNVPLFVNEGDRIRVDTRTGEYMERGLKQATTNYESKAARLGSAGGNTHELYF